MFDISLFHHIQYFDVSIKQYFNVLSSDEMLGKPIKGKRMHFLLKFVKLPVFMGILSEGWGNFSCFFAV